jgi:hypothetical protein
MFYKRLTFLMQLKFRSWQQKSFPTSAHFISLQFLIKFHSGINIFGSKIEDSHPQPPSITIILNHHPLPPSSTIFFITTILHHHPQPPSSSNTIHNHHPLPPSSTIFFITTILNHRPEPPLSTIFFITTILNHPQPPSTTIILNHHLPKLTWHNFSFTDYINYPV